MDWRSVNFDWNRARAFLVAAEEGSLSAAARALGITQPTLGRQVAALEQELGVTLFDRGGRGLELTSNGLALVDYVRSMGEAASRLSMAATGQSDSIEGDICITASESMAVFGLPPVIEKLRRLQPGINIELIASNSTSNLGRREADIAIRGFRPTQPDLIAKKLADISAPLYASPCYLERLGNPTSPEGFNNADFIGFSSNELLLQALNQRGMTLTASNFPVVTENHIVHWELVKQGVGIGVMVQEVGDAEPLVVRALPGFEIYTGTLWLVAHRELKMNRRIKTVFDFLAAELSTPVAG